MAAAVSEGGDYSPPQPVDLGRRLVSFRQHVLEEINARRAREGKPPVDKFGIEHGSKVIVSEDENGALDFDVILTRKPQPAPPPTITCEICGTKGVERAEKIFYALDICWLCTLGTRVLPSSLAVVITDARDRRVIGAACEVIQMLRHPPLAFRRPLRRVLYG